MLDVLQCRRYCGSDLIRMKAEFIYNRFKGLFLVGDDADTFSQVSCSGADGTSMNGQETNFIELLTIG